MHIDWKPGLLCCAYIECELGIGMAAWIEMIDDDDADEELLDVLNLSRTPHGTVDNVMRVHSLRPSTMRGHVVLYRAVLHDAANTLPGWLQECVASWVSILNQCEYSLANHWANARHLIDDDSRAEKVYAALKSGTPESAFGKAEAVLFEYARKLTLEPANMEEQDVWDLRGEGFSDGEILELNQIVGYFNYVNRLLNGLGVSTENDTVGYYASEKS